MHILGQNSGGFLKSQDAFKANGGMVIQKMQLTQSKPNLVDSRDAMSGLESQKDSTKEPRHKSDSRKIELGSHIMLPNG